MATEERQPPGPPGRRRPPTIELEATEVSPGPAEPRNPDDPPGVGSDPFKILREHWRLIAVGGGGALAGALVILLLWLALPRGNPDPTNTLAPRFAAIEMQLRELAARPQPAGADTKALDELTARLAKLEAAVAAPRAPVVDAAVLGRLTATDEALKSLTESVAQLARRTDAIAATLAELQSAVRTSGADRGEIAALGNKIAALEQSNQAIRDELAKRVVTAASDQATRLAMLASALRGAVERGEAFVGELAAVKPLITDAATLAALEPFAATGLPNAAALGRELAALIEPMRRIAVSAAGESSVIDRLQANAQKLVRVRRVDEVAGDTPAAALARIDQKAARGDIAVALAELDILPQAVRAPAQGWIAKAQARQAAVAAANRLAAAALAALKTTP